MARVMADCRRFPSDANCTLTIIGEEAEVHPMSVAHMIKVHGAPDTPELRDQIKGLLEPAQEYQPAGRPPETPPG
jgi:hypothetical protein